LLLITTLLLKTLTEKGFKKITIRTSIGLIKTVMLGTAASETATVEFEQIGRASWRESAWRADVAGALKAKKTVQRWEQVVDTTWE